MQPPYLDIRSPAGQLQLPLAAKPVTVGRHNSNDVPLVDTLVSRFHCIIERGGPTGFRVRDLGSSNGTRVRGQPVTQAELVNGDVVAVGQTTMTLVLSPAPAARGPADDDDIVELGPEHEAADAFADDHVEELTEADLVDETAAELVPLPVFPGSYGAYGSAGRHDDGDDSPLPVDVSEGPAGGAAGQEDPGAALYRMAYALPNQTFDERAIAMMGARGQVVHPAGAEARKANAREAVDLFRLLLLFAFRARATDVHMEPKTDYYQLRGRIDGAMMDIVRLSRDTGTRVAALVKVLSEIDLTQKNMIQEGHFSTRVPGAGGRERRTDYRVSFAPTVHGQKLVMRVMDAATAPGRLNDLQLPAAIRDTIETAVHQESGMLLVCGPTGSGKTTTLYALLRTIDVNERNVVTIEDPVEVELEGVTQIPVDESEGKGFSTLLRSILRQDPDAILFGETRATETARTSMQAAITGHLVFSTVHTKDTPGTVFRLLDLGVEPYMVAQGLHVVLGQRLVRLLCPACKRAVPPTPEQRVTMGPAGEAARVIFTPGGCPRCLQTGYSGRRAFFEMLRATEDLREVILKSPTPRDIQNALGPANYVRLQDTGYQLVAEGAVAFDEIHRAVSK